MWLLGIELSMNRMSFHVAATTTADLGKVYMKCEFGTLSATVLAVPYQAVFRPSPVRWQWTAGFSIRVVPTSPRRPEYSSMLLFSWTKLGCSK